MTDSSRAPRAAHQIGRTDSILRATDSGRQSRIGLKQMHSLAYAWAVPVLTTHRFTVEDYHRMGEAGVLKPDARVELLDGEIIDMAPIGPFHGGSTKSLIKWRSCCSRG